MSVKYVKQSAWIEIKKELFENYPMCKLCKTSPAVHLHHGVVNKGKVRNKSLHKYLDVKENALEVCEMCHKMADAYEIRAVAYRINSERYGCNHMDNWYENLPLRIKERFDG